MEPDQSDDKGRTTPTMKNNLRRGVEFFNSKRYEPAIIEWSKVLREDPTNKNALDYIQKARARISKAATPEENEKVVADAQQCYSIGLQYFQEEEYQMAINQWIRALTYQPDHGEALGYIKDAQSRILSGAAPTKTRPGSPPAAAKVLKNVESGAFAREDVTASPAKAAPKAPAPAAAGGGGGAAGEKGKGSEADNRRLAAEAEALYEEILGSEPAGGASPGAAAKVKPKAAAAGGGGSRKASASEVAAPTEQGILGQLLSFPANHPLLMGGILVVALGVFATLYFVFMATDWVKEMAAARENMKAGKYFEALTNLNEADGVKAGDEDILSLRGECYVELKDWDKAIADLTVVTTMNAKAPKSWYLMGLSHYKKNQFEESVAALRKARDAGLDSEDLRKLLLDDLTAMGRVDDYAKEFPDIEDEKQPPIVLVRLGLIDFLVGDLERAKTRAALAAKKQPTEEEPYLLLMRVLEASGDPKGALAVADDGVAKVAISPRIHYLKAHIQARTGDFEGAIATMALAEGQGGDFRYHMEVGNVWMAQYRRDKRDFFKDKAAAAFQKAVDMNDGGVASLAWGRALLTFGDASNAQVQLKKAAATFKGDELDDLGYSYLWMTYYLMKDYDKAIATLEKAIVAHQSEIASLAAKGITLYAKGDKPGAKEAFDAAGNAQKSGRKVVAPVEYVDVSAEDVKRMMAEVGLQ